MKEIPEETKKKAIALAKAGDYCEAMGVLMRAGMKIQEAADIVVAGSG